MKFYNLFLRSNNYYSTTNTANTLNRTYAVDWTFLPKDKHFKVTFNFCSNRFQAGTTLNNRQYLELTNLGGYNSFTGGNNVEKNVNNILGGLKIKQASKRTSAGQQTDINYRANDKSNSPIYLNDRPSSNFLTIDIISILGSPDASLTAQYYIKLCFEEI